MDDRTYGIELECSTNGQGGVNFAQGVIREVVGQGSPWYNCIIGHDGSEIEVKSPIMTGPDDMAELKAVMTGLKVAGCKVTHVDGMHVHHGAADIKADVALRKQVIESWALNQDAIHTFVAKRRDNSYPCKRVDIACLDKVIQSKAGEAVAIDRYYAINFAALRKGTVELRLHQGSLVADTAEAWIEFGKAFFARAIKETITKTDDPKEFLAKLELPNHCTERLLKNAARRLDEPVTDMAAYYAVYGGQQAGQERAEDE